MDEGDHDDQLTIKNDIATDSLTCFHYKGRFLNILNPDSINIIHRSITPQFHSVTLSSHGDALINENMVQSHLFLDRDHMKTPPNDTTAISPCLKIATLSRRPLCYNTFTQKITPDIDDFFSRRKYRGDSQHSYCIFQCLYRLIVFIKFSSSFTNIFLLDEMAHNTYLPINEDVLKFPNICIPPKTLDLSNCIKHIPVLDDNIDIQHVVMRPSALHELLFALLATLICTLTPPGLQGHDNSNISFSIFSSPFSIITTFLDKSSTESDGGGVSSSSSSSSTSGNRFNCRGTLFSLYCSHLIESLAILYSASQKTWLSFDGSRTCRLDGWFLPSFLQLVLGVVDPWVLECKRRTLSFLTVTDASSENIYNLKSLLHGGNGGYFTGLSKIPRSATSVPYIMQHQEKYDGKLWVYSTKEKWSRTHGEAILKSLCSFDGDSDVGNIAVDTLLELLKTGQEKWKQDKSLAKKVLNLIKNFARTMVSVQSNEDFRAHTLQFTPPVQQSKGTTPTNKQVNDKATQTSSSLEENDDLRTTVVQLRQALRASEETIIKMQLEKNDLETKLRNHDNKLVTIQQLEHHQQPTVATVDSAISRELCFSSTIPTPPPPPPMPALDNSCKERKIRPHTTSKSSTYFHPLALNLNFASLKSLHENTPSSPTSPTSNDNVSLPETPCGQRTAMNQTQLRPASKIIMKQFFWSKLPRERIHNTVWKEISIDETATTVNNTDNNSNKQSARQPWKKQHYYQHHDNKLVDLDIVVLEKLFKKTEGTKAQTINQQQGFQATTKSRRKQPPTTLLEFNRANNIAIMLARIKLTYSEIYDSILKIDYRLNMDNLMAIRQYIPTKEEIETIQDYNGADDTLGNSEKYFKTIMGIPRLADRIDCIIFQRKFNHEIQELLPELDTLQLAIDELRNSHQFKLILKTILAIGNYLNDHTIRGNAYGFHLDALLKMGDTKAEGKSDINLPTLLHYLVFFLSKSGKQKIITSFKDDIPHLDSAAQISPSTLFASVKSLDGNIGHIRKELVLHQEITTSQKMDRFTEIMKTFLEEAEPVVENVKNLARDIQERLKNLIMYYGEDPTLVKPQEFFSVIRTFSSSFEKAKMEIEQARQKSLRQQKNTSKKLSKGELVSASSSSVAKAAPNLRGNSARTSLRTVSTTCSQDGTPKNAGFGQVLQELRAGLKRGDHSWRVEESTRRTSVGHCDRPSAILL